MSQIETLFNSKSITYVPTSDMVLKSQKDIGIIFPDSYVEFTSYYGIGTSNGFFIIDTPITLKNYSGLHNRIIQNKNAFNSKLQPAIDDGFNIGDIDCLEPLDKESEFLVEHISNIIIYGRSINGDFLVWASNGNIFKFFFVDSDCFSIRYTGESIRDLIIKTQTEQIKYILGTGYSPLPRIFDGAKNLD
ncbi:hypothetical protein [Serratia sp. DD3]|uniref:hypothetical protein n=1 Tax=Serratia sp. DD3 TaxID=1410619 RepID=UPI0004D8DC3B|nr:hypothetical protein [Serratia sp. DD3]KEY59968.1 hypothetical protein SRDD_10780 [Serratia sp. DD3]